MTALLVASLASLAAAAPVGEPNQKLEPETIVVTASALGDKSGSVAQGVVVISRGEALQSSLSGGIGEALTGNLGVRSSFYGANASRPIIRGLGEDRIRLLLNGLTGIDASTISPDHAPAIDGLDSQTIEVLKGPSALRFGANAVGGVVNVVDGRLPTELPDADLGGEFFIGGSTAEKSKTLALQTTLKSGQAVYRLDGFKRDGGDYQIPGFAQTAAERAVSGDTTRDIAFNTRGEIWGTSLSAAWIGARMNVAGSLRKTASNYGIPGEEAFIDLKQTRGDIRAEIKDLGLFESVALSVTAGDYTHAEVEFDGAIGTVFKNNGYEGRLEAKQKARGALTGLIGIQFGSNDFSAIGDEAFILPVTIEQSGLFIVERYKASLVTIEVGARAEKRDYSGLAGARSFDLASFSGSLIATPFSGLHLSLNAAQTQRAPTEVELFAEGPHAATQAFERGDPNLKIEVARSVEGTARWTANGVNAELNLWQIGFDGFVSFAPTGQQEDGLDLFVVTQKDATLHGFEARLSSQLWQNATWSVAGDFGYDFVRGTFDAGGNIARMPPSMATLGLQAANQRMSIRGEVQRLEKQNRVAAFETETDGATLVNAHVVWRPSEADGKIELSLEGKNLTDAEVREHTSFLKDVLPRPGRSIKLSLRATF